MSERRSSSAGLLITTLVVFMLASLATLGRDHNGWQSEGHYDISAERWRAGTPIAWIDYVRLDIEGTAPPMRSLPEGRDYLPGLHFAPWQFALALAAALAIASLLPFAWVRMHRALERRDALPRPGALAVFGALGLALLLATRTELPNWVSWILAAFPIPAATIAACWNRPRLALAGTYIASALLVLQVGTWVEDGRPLVDRRWDSKQDLLPVAFCFLLYVGIAAAAFALLRRSRRTREPAT